MSCQINAPVWEPNFIDSAKVVQAGEDYELHLLLESGDVRKELISSDNPMALQVELEGGNWVAQLARADWKAKCKSSVREYKLDPSHANSGLAIRKDGTGIGVSDIRDTGLRIIYINVNSFPVVFIRKGADVFISFQDQEEHFYISPNIPKF